MRARTFGLAALSLAGLMTLAAPVFAQTEAEPVPSAAVTEPVPTSAAEPVQIEFTDSEPVVTTSASTCKLNGKVVPCEELGKSVGKAVGAGLGFILFMVVFGIAASVFWLMMLIHAATHPIQNRAMWILLMVFTGIVGAIIYYFAVKRKFSAAVPGSPAMAAAPGALPGEAPATTPPPAPQLAEYVRNARLQGTGDDAIRQALTASGWNAADVDRALKI